jgi:mono/diheme cytochrome c family protein
MNRKILLATGALSIGLGPLTALGAAKSATGNSSPQAQRGAYLVQMGSCNDCHTPWVFDADLGMPVPDMSRMLSGHPEKAPDPEGKMGKHDIALIGPTFTSFQLPFGTVYAANLTPDKDTGLGSWTKQMFVQAFRKGKHMGGDGRAIMPPMPWMNIAALTDQDLKAVYAYLMSIPPIRNSVPQHKIPNDGIDKVTQSFERLKQRLAAHKP